jgi:hypothetical protein
MIGRILIGIVAAVLSAGPAAAQKKEAPAKAAEAKVPSAAELAGAAAKGAIKDPQKPKVIDFEDETIRGTLTKPEGDFIDSRKKARQRSLIKIRRHFVPELLKSADDL